MANARTTPLYATVAQLRERMRNETDRDDPAMSIALLATEKLIDGYTGRDFGTYAPAAREFRPRNPQHVMIDDAIDIAAVDCSTTGKGGAATWVAVDLDDVIAHTVQGGSVCMIGADLGVFPTGPGAWVRVTPTTGWGWADVPYAVTEATLIHAAKTVKRADAPEGVLGFEGAGVTTVDRRGLDSDARALVNPYRTVTSWAP